MHDDRDFVGVIDDMMVGDDQPVLFDDEAGAEPLGPRPARRAFESGPFGHAELPASVFAEEAPEELVKLGRHLAGR